MWRSRRDLTAKQATAAIFLLLWLGAWWLSLAPHGWMRPDPFLIHFALSPFVAAFLVGWWQRTSDGSSLFPLSAPLAALLVSELGWTISFSRLLLDVVSRPELFSPGWAVPLFLNGAFVMGVAAVIAGSIGGFSGALLAAGLGRVRQRGRGAARGA